MAREIAFIDPSIPDLDVFLSGLRPELGVVLLSANAAAPAQIAAALQRRSEFDAIHVVAHGMPGEIRFSSGTLRAATLAAHAADLAEIGRSLAPNGELLLWSCEAGAGERGVAFIRGLERATKAAVAAATSLVGSEEKGGRWELDCGVRPLSQPPLTSEASATYAGLLISLSLGPTSSYTENTGATRLFGHADIEADLANWVSLISVTIGAHSPSQRLSIANPSAHPDIKYFYSEDFGFLNIYSDVGFLSTEAFEAALNDVVYSDPTNDKPPAQLPISVKVYQTNIFGWDNGDVTRNVVAPIIRFNDQPVVNIATDHYSVEQYGRLNLKNTGINVGDVDSELSDQVTVTLSVTSGTLRATEGLFANEVDIVGSNTNTVTITGRLSLIQYMLGNAQAGSNELYYRPPLGVHAASATLTVTINDNGHTGLPGPATAADTAVISIAPGAGAVDQPLTGNPYIDGLLSGTKWSGNKIVVSAPTDASWYGVPYPSNYSAGFSPLTTQQIHAVNAILLGLQGAPNVISATTLGSFVAPVIQAGNGGGGEILLGRTTSETGASAFFPNRSENGSGGDVWFKPVQFDNPQAGTYEYETHIHELGHAFGLKHPHDEEGTAPNAYPIFPSDKDGMEWTVMSYRDYAGDQLDKYGTTGGNFPQTFMQYDILALQTMYGAWYGAGSNNTNSVYTWNQTSGQMSINGVGQGAPSENRVFLTIWDGGGIDTYDMSNYSGGVRINLAPGGWSITSAAQLAQLEDGHVASGTVYNAFLFNGDLRSIIENAIGGGGNDVIAGNQVANTLMGNGGNDTLSGGGGNDTLAGGAGTDTAVFSGAWINYTIAGASTLTITDTRGGSPDGTDTLSGVESFQFSNGTFNAAQVLNAAPTDVALSVATVAEYAANGTVVGRLSATDANAAVGDTVAFTLLGDAGGRFKIKGDQLQVARGLLLDYEQANRHSVQIKVTDHGGLSRTETFNIALRDVNPETVTADGGASTLVGGAGNDTLRGAGGDDLLKGGGGNDLLDGGTGNDRLEGGAGNDTYVVDSTKDVLVDTVGTDTVKSGISWTLQPGFERLTLLGSSAHVGTGNAAANTITGNSAANTLKGLGGNDTLLGGAGTDTLIGGSGNDEITGGAGKDRMTGGAGDDDFNFKLVSDTGKSSSTRDVITDFKPGSDDIDLSAIDANGSATGNGTFKFVAKEGAKFTGVRGELIWDKQDFSGTSKDKTIISGDINGDKHTDFQIELTGLKNLTAGDFVL